MLKGQSALVALALLAIPGPALAAEDDSLGISVSIVPYANEEGLSAGNDKLWFPVEPGESITREIRVRSYSQVAQDIEIQMFDSISVDGVPRVDFSKPSFAEQWLEVSPGDLRLEPGETKIIAMEFAIPLDSQERSFEGVIRVLGSQSNFNVEGSGGSGVRAVLPGSVAVDVVYWLGIGDALTLMPSFDITSVEGLILDGDKHLRVYFENSGISPVRLTGSVQFADPVFVERVYEPVSFIAPQIAPNESGFVDVLVDQEINDGPWRILVSAEQDGIRQNKLFEQNIEFLLLSERVNWNGVLIQAGLAILFAAISVIGYRLLRKRPPTQPPAVSASGKPVDVTPPTKKSLREPVMALISRLRTFFGGLGFPKLNLRIQSSGKVTHSLRRALTSTGSWLVNTFKKVLGLILGSIDSFAYSLRQKSIKREEAKQIRQREQRIEKVLQLKSLLKELETEDIRIDVTRREMDQRFSSRGASPENNQSKSQTKQNA